MQAMLGRADPLRVERRPNPTQVDAYLNEYILQQIPKKPSEYRQLLQNYNQGASPTNHIISTATTLNPKFTLCAGPEYPGCQFPLTVRIRSRMLELYSGFSIGRSSRKALAMVNCLVRVPQNSD
jgi:5'-deoxynucleotidase YfbR-like HD superfamily hydrolase